MKGSVKRIAVLAVAASLACLQCSADRDPDTVFVRTWAIDSSPSGAPPELADEQLAVPWLKDRPSFGIAFSGGGTRSASASLGELRALHDLGWLARARHISANSGGSWAAVPYTYLPEAIPEERFLGVTLQPGELTDLDLKPSRIDPLAFETAIHDAGTADQMLELGRGDEAYSDIVASIFLEPFGLHENEKFFTFHEGALQTILGSNPALEADDFHVVERTDRPYLIVSGVLLAQQMSQEPEEYFPLEMTPLYTGVRGRFEFEKDGETVVVGGGYVESFGYDSYEPQGGAVDGRWHVRLTGLLRRGDKPIGDRYRFTLSDVIGVSSAAPLGTLSRHRIPNFVFPELRHWAIDREALERREGSVRRRVDEFQHGDGADIDNLALTPLLARRTENILVFVNSADAFREPESGCRDLSEQHISDDVVSLFRKTGRLVHNVVFADGDAGLEDLCRGFAARRASGEPLVHCRAYDVLPNTWHRIEPYRPSICWAYLDRVEGWIEKLAGPAGSLVEQLARNQGPFSRFPHYSTFAEHGVALIDLDRERVLALSNLTAWAVTESAESISSGLPGAALPVPGAGPTLRGASRPSAARPR